MNTFEQLMAPVWDSEIIYDEFLTMVRSNGVCEAPLLFVPEKVLSVTSADKLMEYEEGRDWVVRGNMLCLTENSQIFAFDEEELIFDECRLEESFPTIDGKYSLFKEGHFFHDRQIAVTYKKENGNLMFAPRFCGDLLPKTMTKLRNQKTLKVVLFGDSIAAGANSSGMTLTTPFLPRWGNLFVESLRRHYDTKVEFSNPSVGGKDSYWGLENAKAKVADYRPDLAIIAFGMNDCDEGEVFAENIRKITERIQETSPKTEFILCATTVPNERVKGFYYHQDEHLEALMKLRQEGTAIADFYTMQKHLMSRKRFIDMTGNNLNHPNDFLIRCHAQLLAALLIR
jgi:lysophospholipase L1-like esterase